jgi:hypothetical protein
VVEGRIVGQEDKNVRLRSAVWRTADEPLAEGESLWLLASPAAIARLSAVDEGTLQRFLANYSATRGAQGAG